VHDLGLQTQEFEAPELPVVVDTALAVEGETSALTWRTGGPQPTEEVIQDILERIVAIELLARHYVEE
jgi:hypothetical protein